MFCPNCGKQLPDGVKFCNACGAPQTAGTASRTAAETSSAPERPAPSSQPRPAPAGGLVQTMRSKSIRLSLPPLLFCIAVTVILFAAGGPQLGLAVGAVIAIPCVIPVIKALSGSYQKDALALLQEEDCFDEAEAFFASTSPVNEVYMGRRFVYFQQGRRSVLLRPWDVAWVYHHVTRRYALFIPMGSSHSIVLRTVDGKRFERMIPKNDCQPFLEAAKAALPGAVIGYSAQLEQTYNSDRQSFADRWEQTIPGCTAGHTFR